MGLARFSAVVLLLVVLIVSGAAASGFENTGIGMKARGMGGAFRAIADDWTAAYYNPAGYAWIWDNQIGSNFAFVHHRHSLVPSAYWGGRYDRGIFNDVENFNAHEVLSNPSGGALIRLPLAGETVIGLSAYQRFDQNIQWTLYDPVPTYQDSIDLPNDQFANNLDVVTFQLTFGRELIEDQLAFGLGLQLNRGDLVYSNTYFRENPITNVPDSLQEYDIMQDFPYDRVTQWSKNDGNGWGFGFNAGFLYRVDEKLQVGVSVNVPFSMTIDGTTLNRYYLPKNNTLWENSVDSAGVENPGTVGQLFVSGAVVNHQADFEADLDLPTSFGLGLSYKVSEKLTVAFDAEYTLWSSFEGLSFSYSNHSGLVGPADTSDIARDFFTANVAAPVDWENAGKVMMGAAYEIDEFLSPEIGLTLLGGFSLDQSPAREVNQYTPQFVDNGDKYGFNAGGIFHIKQWDLGLTTSYYRHDDLNVVGVDMDDTYERFPGFYQAETYETTLSFNYRF